MALAAGATVFKTSRLALEDVVIQQALILLDTPCTVQLILRQKLGSAVFEIYSLASDEAAWQLHCSGKIVVEQTSEKLNTTEGGEQITLAQLQRQLVDELAVETHYQQCAEQGIIYGDSFRGLNGCGRATEKR